MLWLWMENIWDGTLVRQAEGGSLGLATLSQRGSESFKDTMTTMKLEIPLLTLAEELAA